MLLLMAIGCKAPPDAPTELEDLCAFFYEHLPDEDPAALQVAVDHLDNWLDAHFDEATEGYTVHNLSQAALDALEVGERDASKLVGAAVATRDHHDLDALVQALLIADQTEVYPDDHPLWERTYRGDPDCFVRHDCEQILFDNHSITKMPLGLELTSDNTGHFRWVEAEAGTALVTRAWLKEPAKVNLDVFRMEDQHYLSVNLPTGRHGLVRLQAMWADAEIIGLDIPDATALNLLVDGMVSKDESLFAWMDAD